MHTTSPAGDQGAIRSPQGSRAGIPTHQAHQVIPPAAAAELLRYGKGASMSLWNPRKPLNQPPAYGRIQAQDQTPAYDRAKVIHQAAQFERFTQTRKYGIRHEVK